MHEFFQDCRTLYFLSLIFNDITNVKSVVMQVLRTYVRRRGTSSSHVHMYMHAHMPHVIMHAHVCV